VELTAHRQLDIHPREPWVLAALYDGNVYIWNYQTQALVKSFEVLDLPGNCVIIIIIIVIIVITHDLAKRERERKMHFSSSLLSVSHHSLGITQFDAPSSLRAKDGWCAAPTTCVCARTTTTRSRS
jgi:hypothetical protein